ncbi:pitrilysin family protein [Maricaulis sp.]|uniref:M16 family metallopeptidase n=1 Tax=Maricaulis sp. TaxID=1486257 RepID=UPI002B26E1A7|nr:pitrilysin family protein [Maricaulis sp.]
MMLADRFRTLGRTILVLLAGLASLTATGLADQPGRGLVPPAPGEPLPFELPASQSLMLENGLTVTFIPWGLTPTLDIVVSVRAGNIDDGEQTWIADLTTAMIEEGFAGLDRAEIGRRFAAMGGALNTTVTQSHTLIGAHVLSDHGEDALALIADAVRRPDFPPDALARISAGMSRDIELRRQEPDSLAFTTAFQSLFPPDHPFHFGLPRPGQVDGFTINDVRDFHAAKFGAGRTHLYIAGRFDAVRMEAAVREAFGDWPRGEQDNAPLAIPARGPVVHLVDRPGSLQTTIHLVYPVGAITSKDATALSVMDAALGGALAASMREAGWSYSPSSFIQWTRGGGMWTYTDDIDTPRTVDALTSVFETIASAREQTWNMDGTRRWLASLFVMSTGSTYGLLENLALRDAFRLDHDYLDRRVPALMSVTDREVNAVARAYLRDDRLTFVVVGDLARFEVGLRALPALEQAEFVRRSADAALAD